MNEHFNKATRQYRYKSKESKEIIFRTIKHQNNDVLTIGKIKHTIIKYNYKPHFIYRLFWYIRYTNPIIKLDKPSKRHITIVGLMVVTIIAMFIIYSLD